MFSRLKDIIIGHTLNLRDRHIFQRLSLAAFLGWVGLGADGMASSCYGPQEAYLILGQHAPLALFVAILTALTIFVISASYSHIIEVFPAGGGGYTVASTLLSPTTGMISGCALLVDYLLDVTLSLASGTDAIFSFLPQEWQAYKLPCACAGVIGMTMINLRGVKESVRILLPVFLAFLLTHVFAIAYGLLAQAGSIGDVASETAAAVGRTSSQLGLAGTLFLVLKAYGMGGGTYTGLEAVSNGLPILKSPKEETGKRTMLYMALSLAAVVGGLFLNYVLFEVGPEPGKTLNAVLLGRISQGWGGTGQAFTTFALLTEAAILAAGAQTGFLDGPRVMSYMAEDFWLPARFKHLSRRLVISNGILVLGCLSLVVMLLTQGSVGTLVVLFSINVFITFVLSQLSMVVHWLKSRHSGRPWKWRMFVNGLGFSLSCLILVTMIAVKFTEGGWITLVCTGCLAGVAYLTRRHYGRVHNELEKLNQLTPSQEAAENTGCQLTPFRADGADRSGDGERVAVVIVYGYNGFGVCTLSSILGTFEGTFNSYVFLQAGVVEARAFKDEEVVEHMEGMVRRDLEQYTNLVRRQGYKAHAVSTVGTDIVDSLVEEVRAMKKRYPKAVFFSGHVVFPRNTILLRFLHNDVVYAVQKRLDQELIPFFVIPVRVPSK